MRVTTEQQNNYITPIDRHGKIQNQQICVYAKCISNESSICTKKGKILLGNIKPNTEFKLFSYDLLKNKIEEDEAIRIISGNKKVYEIITISGKKIRASKDHIFFVKCGKKIIEKRLEELNDKDYILTQ